jgi:uncharacterized protein with HEPN domain
MPPEARKLLADMILAAKTIVKFSKGKKLADFGGDDLLRSGIYYQFVILGEGLAQVRQLHPETAENISEYWRIVGFRNQIIHGYSRVDDEITWRIISDKLPILRRELKKLSAE